MSRYIKKPVVIEAVQWTGKNPIEIAEFLQTGVKTNFFIESYNDTVSIETLEGMMIASLNDYIIKGVKGEFYPCKPDIFEETYAEVGECV